MVSLVAVICWSVCEVKETSGATSSLPLERFDGTWEVFGGTEVDGWGHIILERLHIDNGRVRSEISCTDAMSNLPGKISSEGVYEGYGSGWYVDAKINGFFSHTRGYGKIYLFGDEVNSTGYWIAFKRKPLEKIRADAGALYDPPKNSNSLKKITDDKQRSYYYTWAGQKELSTKFEHAASIDRSIDKRQRAPIQKAPNEQGVKGKRKFDELVLKLRRVDYLLKLKHIGKLEAKKQKKLIIDRFFKTID